MNDKTIPKSFFCTPVVGDRIHYLNDVSDVNLHRKLHRLAVVFLEVDRSLLFSFKILFTNLNGLGSIRITVFKVYNDKEYVYKVYGPSDITNWKNYYKSVITSCEHSSSDDIEAEIVYDLEDGGLDIVMSNSVLNSGGFDTVNIESILQN